jgi:hypothetical protein
LLEESSDSYTNEDLEAQQVGGGLRLLHGPVQKSARQDDEGTTDKKAMYEEHQTSALIGRGGRITYGPAMMKGRYRPMRLTNEKGVSSVSSLLLVTARFACKTHLNESSKDDNEDGLDDDHAQQVNTRVSRGPSVDGLVEDGEHLNGDHEDSPAKEGDSAGSDHGSALEEAQREHGSLRADEKRPGDEDSELSQRAHQKSATICLRSETD